MTRPPLLLIACGALAREIQAVIALEGGQGLFALRCLPASLHNTPALIPEKVRTVILRERPFYEKIFVLYADCGTGGRLDAVLEETGVERIEGPHCYSFFMGNASFEHHSTTTFSAFYLTDFLTRHFDRLVWRGLGLDRYPELLPTYFASYTELIYLAQTSCTILDQSAQQAAQKLNLPYRRYDTGYGDLSVRLKTLIPSR